MAEISRLTALKDLPELLRVPEVAAFYDCSTYAVREMVRRNELPSIRLGRLLRIKRDGLVAVRVEKP